MQSILSVYVTSLKSCNVRCRWCRQCKLHLRNLGANMPIEFKFQHVGDAEIFYREAGPAVAPVLLLLHGFPTSSHMFRDLIPKLANSFRVIAPDLPGFGNTV